MDPDGGSVMTPARYPVPPIPELSVVVLDSLDAASPARPAVGSPAGDKSLLAQMSPSGSVAQAFSSSTSSVLWSMSVHHRDWQPWTSICHGVLHRRWGSPLIPLCFWLP